MKIDRLCAVLILASLTACASQKCASPTEPAAATLPPKGSKSVTVAAGPPAVINPTPARPVWVNALIGKPLSASFPKVSTNCLGYLDGAILRYQGKPSGERFHGWSFDADAKAVGEHILLTDADGRIAGGADGGFARPDVSAGVPQIKSTTAGWEGVVGSDTKTPITAWLAMHEQGTVCLLQLAHVGAGDL